MHKALIATIIILSLLLTGGAIIGIDVYLSFQDYKEMSNSFNISEPTYVLSEGNLTADITVFVNSPKLGYIPKTADVEVIILQNSVQYCNPINFKIKIGEEQRVDFTITISQVDRDRLDFGVIIYFDIQITAIPIYLGIPIKSLTQVFDEFYLAID